MTAQFIAKIDRAKIGNAIRRGKHGVHREVEQRREFAEQRNFCWRVRVETKYRQSTRKGALHRGWVEVTACGDEAFAGRHTNDIVHRMPQRVLPLLIGTKRRHWIGLCSLAPARRHFRSVHRVTIEQFGNALRGGQGALGIREPGSQRRLGGEEAEQRPAQAFDRPRVVGGPFGANGMEIELVRKPEMNVGEDGLAGAVGIELMAELFNEPIAGAGGGHDHDVGQEGVGQRRA